MLTSTPGTVCSITHGSRADGTSRISTSLMSEPVMAVRVSMTGVASVMVISSETAGLSLKSICEFEPMLTSTERSTGENPLSSARTL